MYTQEECALMKNQVASQYQKSRVRLNQLTHQERALKIAMQKQREFMGLQKMNESY